MGSFKEGREESHGERRERVKTCIVYSWSLMVSMIGGLTMGWWEYEYHPTNSQLWMVPFGLVLLITPLFAWFSIFVSDLCSSKVEDAPSTAASQPVRPLAGDLERSMIKSNKLLPTVINVDV
ncbi:hypothetical protein RGQ29_028301 [Quercus rubra]|uniref:Uncharacterized protein n=1 Tax=Quercus rubra TaxID=3512 RepID=A0AAN7ILU6_QUERU|nr:hypothetical protein RGQ29_028301 [Quercus rubra]